MYRVAIVGGAPKDNIPSLKKFEKNVDYWIGADGGAVTITQQNVPLDLAIGDFDSVSQVEKNYIEENAKDLKSYPKEKNETDLELAIYYALSKKPTEVLLFGVTGGRFDHTMINVQMLYTFVQKGIQASIYDSQNKITCHLPGKYEVFYEEEYPILSFLPLSETVMNLSLEGFYYPLESATVHWGLSRTISNELIEEKGTFSFSNGILLLVKSRDA
ncbi:thiamine diphosphokinase [Bacillaceae bacterium S4-13-56]